MTVESPASALAQPWGCLAGRELGVPVDKELCLLWPRVSVPGGISMTVGSGTRKGSTVCDLGLPGARSTLTCWSHPRVCCWGDSAFGSAVG